MSDLNQIQAINFAVDRHLTPPVGQCPRRKVEKPSVHHIEERSIVLHCPCERT